jgi:hypothetical protein
MKFSRALALYGIPLDKLLEALRDGDVKSRWWGKQEVLPPQRWRKAPMSLEDLDQKIDLDPESLQETFGDAAEAPARHGSAGRKPGGRSQGPAIVHTFLRMVEDGGISTRTAAVGRPPAKFRPNSPITRSSTSRL